MVGGWVGKWIWATHIQVMVFGNIVTKLNKVSIVLVGMQVFC